MNKKKLILIISIAVVVIVGIVVGIVLGTKDKNPPEESYRSIKLYEAEGSITVSRNGTEMAGYQQMALRSNDTISVGADSHAIMKLEEDKYVYAYANTVFTLISSEKDASKTVIKLLQGELTSELKQKLAADQSFEVETPNSTMAIRGTVFFVRVESESGGVNVGMQVLEGSVAVSVIRPTAVSENGNQFEVSTFPLSSNEGVEFGVAMENVVENALELTQGDGVTTQTFDSVGEAAENTVDIPLKKIDDIDEEKFKQVQKFEYKKKTITVTFVNCYDKEDSSRSSVREYEGITVVSVNENVPLETKLVGWSVDDEILLDKNGNPIVDKKYSFFAKETSTIKALYVNTYSISANVKDKATGYVGNVDDLDSRTDELKKQCVEGETVTIEAYPKDGYTFVGWYDKTALIKEREYISSNPVLTLESVKENRAVIAEFAPIPPDYKLLLNVADTGLSCTADGAPSGTTTLELYGERPHLDNVTVSLKSNTGTSVLTDDLYNINYGGFGDYDEVGTFTITYSLKADTTVRNSLTITLVDNSNTLTIYNVTPSQGTVTVNDTELTTTAAHVAHLLPDDNALLSAEPANGYEFIGWYSDAQGEELVYSETEKEFLLTADVTLYAVFAQLKLKLNVINTGLSCTKDGLPLATTLELYGERPNLDNVIVSLESNAGTSELTGDLYDINYGGFGDYDELGTFTITYSLKADTAVTASLTITLVDNSNTLTVYNAEPSYGAVAVNTQSLTTAEPYVLHVFPKDSVQIFAMPADSYEFTGWYSDALGEELVYTEAEKQFLLREDVTLYAVFAEAYSALTVYADYVDEGSVSVNGQTVSLTSDGYSEDYREKSQVTLAATPEDGFSFYGWYTGDRADEKAVLVSREAQYAYTVGESDYALYARFCGELTDLLHIENGYVTERPIVYVLGQGEPLDLSSMLQGAYSVPDKEDRFVPIIPADITYEITRISTQEIVEDESQVWSTPGDYEVSFSLINSTRTATIALSVMSAAPTQGVTLTTNGLNGTDTDGFATSISVKPTAFGQAGYDSDFPYAIDNEITYDNSTDVLSGLKADVINTQYNFRILAPYYNDIVQAGENSTARFSLSIPTGFSLFAVITAEGALSEAVSLSDGNTGMIEWSTPTYDEGNGLCIYRFVAVNNSVMAPSEVGTLLESYFSNCVYVDPFSAILITVKIVEPLLEVQLNEADGNGVAHSAILDTEDSYYACYPNSPIGENLLTDLEKEGNFDKFATEGISFGLINPDGTITLSLSAIGDVAIVSAQDGAKQQVAFDDTLSTDTVKVAHLSPTDIKTIKFSFIHEGGYTDFTLCAASYQLNVQLSNQTLLFIDITVYFAPPTICETTLAVINDTINTGTPLTEAPLTAAQYGYNQTVYDLFFSADGLTQYNHLEEESNNYSELHFSMPQ